MASALKTQVPQQAKKRYAVYQKLVFKGKRRKIHIHQRAFKVFMGDPFAQYWCIDFGLLFRTQAQVALITLEAFKIRIFPQMTRTNRDSSESKLFAFVRITEQLSPKLLPKCTQQFPQQSPRQSLQQFVCYSAFGFLHLVRTSANSPTPIFQGSVSRGL